MIRLTLSQMRKSVGRLVAAGIAIMIGTAFVAATLVAGETITRTSTDAIAAVYGKSDLVVVGNVCRRDNPEARAAIDGGLAYDSMPGAIERFFLSDRPGFVVAGTHGKTTTTTLLAHLLHKGGRDPGLLVGGIPKDFPESFRIGGPGAPFVLEGDEYDSAFFDKTAKFLKYVPTVAVINNIEFDHADIYADLDAVRLAFRRLVNLVPRAGLTLLGVDSPEAAAMRRLNCSLRSSPSSSRSSARVLPRSAFSTCARSLTFFLLISAPAAARTRSKRKAWPRPA